MKHIKHYMTDATHMRDDSPMYAFDGACSTSETRRICSTTLPFRIGSRRICSSTSVKTPSTVSMDRVRSTAQWFVGAHRSFGDERVERVDIREKRWALYPPRSVDKETIKPRGIGLDGEAVTWFNKMYPRTTTGEWKARGLPPPIDVIQHPGEIMFVPDGWWHAVLNLDHTMAVTQNFSTSARFDAVWRITRRARPKMSGKWLEKLRLVRPDLAAVADAQPRRSEASAGRRRARRAVPPRDPATPKKKRTKRPRKSEKCFNARARREMYLRIKRRDRERRRQDC